MSPLEGFYKLRYSANVSVVTKNIINTILASGLTLIVLMLGASSMHLAFDKTEFPHVILGSQFRFIGGWE